MSDPQKVLMHKPFVEAAKIDGIVLFRFMPGEDLFTSLKQVVKDHGIERGVILSAIGSVKDVTFVNVKPHIGIPVRVEDMSEMKEAGPFELLSLEGNVFPSREDGEPVIHLHAILGTASGSVSGGHLLKATVFTTAEIILGNMVGSSVYKAMSVVTQRMELLKR